MPITFIFTGFVIEGLNDPATPPLTGPVQLTYTFDSDLPDRGRSFLLGNYGPINATLDFRGASFALPLNSDISVSALDHVYWVSGQARNVTIDNTRFSEVSFRFTLFDDDFRAFPTVALPLEASFASGIDRFEVELRADSRLATFSQRLPGTPLAFTLVVPENGTAVLMAVGLLVLVGLRFQGPHRSVILPAWCSSGWAGTCLRQPNGEQE
jgi:hypothetical protein